MRNFGFAALIAVVAAQNNQEMTPMNFPTNISGEVSSEGYINEIVQTSATGIQSAVLWAAWTTTCNDCNFVDRALVQNWMQMEGTETGKYTGFTCTAVWNSRGSFNATPAVINYENIDSLAEVPSSWNAGMVETTPKWWNAVNNDKETVYATRYSKNSLSSQGCGAWARLFQSDADGNFNADGEAGEKMEEMYWRLKNGGAKQV